MSSSTDSATAAFEPVRFGCLAADEDAAATAPERGGAVPWGDLATLRVVEEPPETAAAEAATDGGGEARPEEAPLLFDEAELARICAVVAARVEREAFERAEHRARELRSAAVVAFETQLANLAARDDAFWRELAGRLAEVVHGLATAALPALMRRLAGEEIRLALADILTRLGPEEHIRVHVAPELAEVLSEAFGSREGKVDEHLAWRLVGDPAMAPGDFRIERPHGFLERRVADICGEITEAVAAVLGAPCNAPQASTEPTGAEGSGGEQPAEEEEKGG